MRLAIPFLAAAAASLALGATPARGQATPPPAASPASAVAAPRVVPAGVPATASTVRPAVQSAGDAVLVRRLVVQTFVALHQANETGDYSTFRALAAPAFQARNDDAALARTFAPLRSAAVDLGVAVVSPPTFAPAPFLDADDRLRVQGTLSIPQPNGTALAAYAMTFAPVNGVWRLQEIAVRDASAGPR